MSRADWAVWASIFALVFPSGFLRAQSSDDPMVIVLTNGAVMQGNIANVAGGLSIRNERGSVATLRFDQIAVLSDSIDGAYRELTDGVDLRKPDEISRWFDWTLSNGLFDRAAELLDLAESQRLDAYALQHMRRRLETAAFTPPQPASVEAAHQSTAADNRPTSAEIDDAIDALPDGMEGFFNQQLHTKLLIGCSAAQCHDRQHQTLPLWHDGLGRVNPRGYTRHNLYQLLQWTDRDDPGRSRLLDMAQTAHGGQDKPTYQSSDDAFLLLQYWSYAVSRVPQKYLTEVAGMSMQPAAEPAVNPPQEPSLESEAIAQVGFLEAPKVPKPTPPTGAVTPDPNISRIDPCDPAIFNAQFHPDRNR